MQCDKMTTVYPSPPLPSPPLPSSPLHCRVLPIYSHVIRLHENYSLIKVVAMVTQFYVLKETLTVKYTLLGTFAAFDPFPRAV